MMRGFRRGLFYEVGTLGLRCANESRLVVLYTYILKIAVNLLRHTLSVHLFSVYKKIAPTPTTAANPKKLTASILASPVAVTVAGPVVVVDVGPEEVLVAALDVKAQVLFLNSVALSKTAPSRELMNSCVKCVQLWNVRRDQP